MSHSDAMPLIKFGDGGFDNGSSLGSDGLAGSTGNERKYVIAILH